MSPASVPTAAGPSAPRLDADGHLAEEIPCRRCAYSLQGLDPTGACPECGEDVAPSIRGDRLRFAEPWWLRRLTTGVWWMIGGLVAVTAVQSSGPIAIAFLAMQGAGNATAIMTAVLIVLTAIAGGIMAVAAWLITTPEAGRAAREGRVTARGLARWCIPVQVIAAPLQLAAPAAGAAAFVPAGGIGTVLVAFQLLLLACTAVVTVGEIAGLVYLRQLARRVPRRQLAAQTTVVIWGFLASQVVAIVFGVFAAIALPGMISGISAGAGPGSASLAMLALGSCTVLGLGLIFGIWALVVLVFYGVAFGATLKDARQISP